jgi:hypothetical protein
MILKKPAPDLIRGCRLSDKIMRRYEEKRRAWPRGE